jgi:probable HAF family extracellular repeat protein
MKTAETIRHYVDEWNGHDAANLVGIFTKEGTYCGPLTYPGINVAGKAQTHFRDEKEWTILDELRGTAAATIVEPMPKLGLTIFLILLISASAFADPGHSITFDAPGAGTAHGNGTFVNDMNDLGQVVGFSLTDNNLYHGYVRHVDGRIEAIDVPGAGSVPGLGEGTAPEGINNEGTIVGQYEDGNLVTHAFVRKPDGGFITFDAPEPNQGTVAVDINSEGTIVGFWIDSNGANHGFIRTRAGALKSFDAPNAGKGLNQGTIPAFGPGLNPSGVSTGRYLDSQNITHGYVRQQTGAITSFDPPGSTNTYAEGINPEGTIVGSFSDKNNASHSFVRKANGVINTFDVPSAFNASNAMDISPLGVITGNWGDSNIVYHGFVRYPNGVILKFDAPGAGTVPESAVGTFPLVINCWGEITGVILDSNIVFHGFIRIP